MFDTIFSHLYDKRHHVWNVRWLRLLYFFDAKINSFADVVVSSRFYHYFVCVYKKNISICVSFKKEKVMIWHLWSFKNMVLPNIYLDKQMSPNTSTPYFPKVCLRTIFSFFLSFGIECASINKKHAQSNYFSIEMDIRFISKIPNLLRLQKYLMVTTCQNVYYVIERRWHKTRRH